MPHGVCCVSRFRIGQALLLFVFLVHSKVMSLFVSRTMLRLRQPIGRSVYRPSHIFPSTIPSNTRSTVIRLTSTLSYSDVQDGRQFFHKPKSARDFSHLSEPACIKEYIPPVPAAESNSTSETSDVQDVSTSSSQNDAAQAEVAGRRKRVPAVAPLSREQLNANANRNGQNDWDYVSSIPIDPVEVLMRCNERNYAPTTTGSDLELTFVGTASCNPSITRGVSCVALRSDQEIMLFDCGEGAQLQLMRASIKISRIKRIFVTHLHGDHAFGLAGVLCMMGQAMHNQNDKLNENGNGGSEATIEPVEIYGPEGIRDMIRAVVQLSYSMIVPPHRIHELKSIPKPKGIRHAFYTRVGTRLDSRFNELEGGRDIYPDSQGQFHLYTDSHFTVSAASMVHTIPCVGYVVTEHDKAGSLRTEFVEPIIAANQESLNTIYALEAQQAEEAEVKAQAKNSFLTTINSTKGKGLIKPRSGKQKKPVHWRQVFKDLKAMKPDDVFRFPDGTVVKGSDVMDPVFPGRKIVFMGDTCSAEYIEKLAQNCDVLIHEATNSFFPGLSRFDTQKELEHNTKRNGHSTPEMAAQEAFRLNAKALLLTHFSTRHLGDASEESVTMMMQIEGMAKRAYEKMLPSRTVSAMTSSTDSVSTLITEDSTNLATIDESNSPEGESTATIVNPSPTYPGEPYMGIPIVAAYDFMKYPVYRRGSHEKRE